MELFLSDANIVSMRDNLVCHIARLNRPLALAKFHTSEPAFESPAESNALDKLMALESIKNMLHVCQYSGRGD